MSLESATSTLEMITDEEQDCIDNTPDNLQESDRYSRMEDAVYALESAAERISDAIELIEEASSK